MATYITTIKFTPQGIANIQDTTKRASALKASAKRLGVKVADIFWTLGAFDGLLVFEAPDDESATALMLHIGTNGNRARASWVVSRLRTSSTSRRLPGAPITLRF